MDDEQYATDSDIFKGRRPSLRMLEHSRAVALVTILLKHPEITSISKQKYIDVVRSADWPQLTRHQVRSLEQRRRRLQRVLADTHLGNGDSIGDSVAAANTKKLSIQELEHKRANAFVGQLANRTLSSSQQRYISAVKTAAWPNLTKREVRTLEQRRRRLQQMLEAQSDDGEGIHSGDMRPSGRRLPSLLVEDGDEHAEDDDDDEEPESPSEERQADGIDMLLSVDQSYRRGSRGRNVADQWQHDSSSSKHVKIAYYRG